jgi:DNA-binding Lrp family transcriptional regulator
VAAANRESSDTGGAPSEAGRAGMLSSVRGLSDLDRGLIRHLQADGRASYASLATQLGTTEKVIRSRTLSLLSSGIIDITTVTDPKALGYRYVSMIGVRTAGAGRTAVAQQLAQLDGVDYVVVTTGRYNIIVEVFCRTLADLRDRIENGIQSIPGVVDVESYLYLSLYYQEGAFETARSKTELNGGASVTAPEFDDIDISIVNLLSDNGREPFRAIADKLAISETQVRRRVARMQNDRALRIMAIANPMSLGLEVVAFVAIGVAPPTAVTDVAQALSGLTSVTYVAICAGRFDIFAEVVCTTAEDLVELMDAGIRTIPGVEHVESYVYLDLQYRRVPPAAPVGRLPSAN